MQRTRCMLSASHATLQHRGVADNPWSSPAAGLSRPLLSWEFDIWPDLFIDILAGSVIVEGNDGNAGVFFDTRRHGLGYEA